MASRLRPGCWPVPGCCAVAWPAGRAVPKWLRTGGGPARAVGWPGWPWRRRASGGINFLLSVLLLVWVADIVAYFAGRRFGRSSASKLAPADQPGQELGRRVGRHGRCVVLSLAWVCGSMAPAGRRAELLQPAVGGPGLVVCPDLPSLFLAAMSVVGDLVESLIKRSAGVKDSSGLLPGHGGVLDRVDALLPVLPLGHDADYSVLNACSKQRLTILGLHRLRSAPARWTWSRAILSASSVFALSAATAGGPDRLRSALQFAPQLRRDGQRRRMAAPAGATGSNRTACRVEVLSGAGSPRDGGSPRRSAIR